MPTPAARTRVPGRDFHVRLAAEAEGGRLRAEVSDTRAERWPSLPALLGPDTESKSGRGLLLVASLAYDWGVTDRRGGPGKTVWASVDMSCPAEPNPALSSTDRTPRR
ncbi:ATP-binding protein [Streptomyces cellulosae]